MSLDVPHRRRFSRRDMSEVFEMQVNSEVTKPAGVAGWDYFEKVLVQSARSTGPQHAFQ